VRREVVGDDVDFLAPRLIDHDVSEEGHELGRGVTRPGDNGNTASLRSSAWIAVFSFTQNTAACCGGFRYTR
jgi:hypothetical protein